MNFNIFARLFSAAKTIPRRLRQELGSLSDSRLDQKLVNRVRGQRWPRLAKWRYLRRFLNEAEWQLLTGALAIALISSAALITLVLINNLERVPKSGGEYAEAVVGQPKLLNPLFGNANKVDAELITLLYSGLFHRTEAGKLAPDLAERYTISADQKHYEVTLRAGLRWSDGEPVSADDIVYTWSAVLNADSGSPLSAGFQGLQIEKINDRAVRFILPQPFAPFLDSLTLGILPEHVWGAIPPSGLRLAKLNLEPVGTGPWRFFKLIKDSAGNIQSYTIIPNEHHRGRRPYLKQLTFKFYPTDDQALDAVKSGAVAGAVLSLQENSALGARTELARFNLRLPQYTALFFNERHPGPLQEIKIREALALALDRSVITRDVLNGAAVIIDGPLNSGQLGFHPTITSTPFAPETAIALLDANWPRLNRDEYKTRLMATLRQARENEFKKLASASTTPALASSTIERMSNDLDSEVERQMIAEQPFYRGAKPNGLLAITITTLDSPSFAAVAQTIAKFWRAIGIATNVITVSERQLLHDIIKNRRFEVLLYGEIVGADPDLFAFWHSSQIDYPGLNLTGYKNSVADNLLTAARTTNKDADRAVAYRKFQELLARDRSAIFLYSPTLTFIVHTDVKGIALSPLATPEIRLAAMNKWYLKTSWRWKP